MTEYFKLAEFSAEQIPVDVALKIEQFHVPNLNRAREVLGAPIRISQKSGYRSVETELRNGRPGTSQHCFRGAGAVDVTADDLEALGSVLLRHTDYLRICYYPTKHFYHCDFKTSTHRLYVCDDGVNWKRAR